MLHRQSRERIDDLLAPGVIGRLGLGGQRRDCGGHWISEKPRPLFCTWPTLG
jgi:hypothetical protein